MDRIHHLYLIYRSIAEANQVLVFMYVVGLMIQVTSLVAEGGVLAGWGGMILLTILEIHIVIISVLMLLVSLEGKKLREWITQDFYFKKRVHNLLALGLLYILSLTLGWLPSILLTVTILRYLPEYNRTRLKGI